MTAYLVGWTKPRDIFPTFTPTAKDEARFWAKVKVNTETGCWEWQGARQGGSYGNFYLNGACRPAHRVSYQWLVGPIGEGLDMDHLCRNPPCVNPAHLEPVTHRVNVRRGISVAAANARKTHCSKGHELSEENVRTGGGRRTCKTCDREAVSRRYYANRPADTPPTNAVKTHCINGHEFTPENTYIPRDRVARQCRECHRIRTKERRARARQQEAA